MAKKVEARGVPKNKVARQVVKELTAREILSQSRIYEGLGTEQKRKYRKREIEETFPQVEIASRKSSTNQQAIQAVTTGTGRSETSKDMNGRLNIKLASEGLKQIDALRPENESLKENGRLKEKEESELIKEIAHLTKENARLNSKIEVLEEQLAEKTEQLGELRKDKEGLQKDRQIDFLRVIQEKFYDEPGLLKAEELEKVSEKAGRDIETTLQHYDAILRDAAESGLPVPLGTYIIIKPNKVLVPVRVMVDFDKRKVEISLWEKKLEIPSPFVSVSSDASKVRF